DMATSAAVDISDDQGSDPMEVTDVGSYYYGSYTNGTPVTITTVSTAADSASCLPQISNPLTQEYCVPENDNYAEAIMVPVNEDRLCEETLSATMAGATSSGMPLPCLSGLSSTSHDVWFSFVATDTTHLISFYEEDEQPDQGAIIINQGLYAGDSYDDLSLLQCNYRFYDQTTQGASQSPNLLASDLSVGETYYIRAYTKEEVNEDFTVCITTPGAAKNNTCSEIAPLCTSVDDQGEPVPRVFPINYYMDSLEFAEEGPYYLCGGFDPGDTPGGQFNGTTGIPTPSWFYLRIQ